jgi:hypothetical protein
MPYAIISFVNNEPREVRSSAVAMRASTIEASELAIRI